MTLLLAVVVEHERWAVDVDFLEVDSRAPEDPASIDEIDGLDVRALSDVAVGNLPPCVRYPRGIRLAPLLLADKKFCRRID